MLMFFPVSLKAGMQGAELVGLFGDKFLQPMVVVVIQGRRAATARLVDQPISLSPTV